MVFSFSGRISVFDYLFPLVVVVVGGGGGGGGGFPFTRAILGHGGFPFTRAILGHEV